MERRYAPLRGLDLDLGLSLEAVSPEALRPWPRGAGAQGLRFHFLKPHFWFHIYSTAP